MAKVIGRPIELGHGVKVLTFEPPPEGFDPLTASPGDLEKHGLPPVADNEHQRRRYERIVHALKGRLRFIEPTLSLNKTEFIPIRQKSKRTPTIKPEMQVAEFDRNWSGAVVYNPQGQSFYWVSADWTVPAIQPVNPDEIEIMRSWVGIDGDGTQNMVLAGVKTYYAANELAPVNYTPFCLWSPWGPYEVIPGLTVSAGDFVHAHICTGGAGANSAIVRFINYTTRKATTLTLVGSQGSPLVGHSAEWIVSKDIQGSIDPQFPNYSSLTFLNCVAELTPLFAGASVGGGTGTPIIMEEFGQRFSKGVPTPPSSVQCQWIRQS